MCLSQHRKRRHYSRLLLKLWRIANSWRISSEQPVASLLSVPLSWSHRLLFPRHHFPAPYFISSDKAPLPGTCCVLHTSSRLLRCGTPFLHRWCPRGVAWDSKSLAIVVVRTLAQLRGCYVCCTAGAAVLLDSRMNRLLPLHETAAFDPWLSSVRISSAGQVGCPFQGKQHGLGTGKGAFWFGSSSSCCNS
jgi:hypothetical protein